MELRTKVRIIFGVLWKPSLSLPLWLLLSCRKSVYCSLVEYESTDWERDMEAVKRRGSTASPRSRSRRISIVRKVTTRQSVAL